MLHPNLLRKAIGFQVAEQVLFDPREREYRSPAREVPAHRVKRFEPGEVDFDIGFDVENEPGDRVGQAGPLRRAPAA